MKTNLKDVTFTIPVRYDTDDRVENVTLIVDYINHHFDTNIIVLEEDKEQKFSFLKDKVDYRFVKCDDPNLHRTKCLNDMAKMANTPIISNYDTDVLFKVQNYIGAANLIREGKAEMVFPYEGPFMECARTPYFARIRESLSVDGIEKEELHCNHPNSVGGCIFWNKSTFMRIGMENQNFKSWGWEDNERIARATKLGVSMKRTSGILYHMSHKRLADSMPNNAHYNNNQREFNKVNAMNKQQLENYVKTWDWSK